MRALCEQGALGVQTATDPAPSLPPGREILLAWFDAGRPIPDEAGLLRLCPRARGLRVLSTRAVADERWVERWIASLDPFDVGGRFRIVPVADAARLKELLARILGVHRVVRKTRQILLVDNVRIHLDEVEGLGTFLELEAVFDGSAAGETRERAKLARLLGGEVRPAHPTHRGTATGLEGRGDGHPLISCFLRPFQNRPWTPGARSGSMVRTIQSGLEAPGSYRELACLAMARLNPFSSQAWNHDPSGIFTDGVTRSRTPSLMRPDSSRRRSW